MRMVHDKIALPLVVCALCTMQLLGTAETEKYEQPTVPSTPSGVALPESFASTEAVTSLLEALAATKDTRAEVLALSESAIPTTSTISTATGDNQQEELPGEEPAADAEATTSTLDSEDESGLHVEETISRYAHLNSFRARTQVACPVAYSHG